MLLPLHTYRERLEKTVEGFFNNDRQLTYMKQLDGLRAFAVFAVLWTHYLPYRYWFGIYWGGLGVRLFFVLSGFLVTGLLLKCHHPIATGRQTRQFSLRHFYIRRFLRLLPLYYAVLILAAVLDFPPVRETFGWHLSYLSNVYFAINGNFSGSVSHLWSLSVEEQFYLGWAWLILFMPKQFLLPSIIGAVAIAPTFRFIGDVAHVNQVALWVLTPSYLDTLGLGGLLAYVTYQDADPSNANGHLSKATFLRVCFWVGIPLMVFTQLLHHAKPYNLIYNSLGDLGLGLTFAWLIHKASTGFGGVIGQTLEAPPIVYLGQISYGIYLLHAFMFVLIDAIFHKIKFVTYGATVVPAVVASIATIALASLFWFALEKPMNQFKRLFPYLRERRATVREPVKL